MSRKTPEEHELEKQLAADLIRRGQVRSWADLGRIFSITPQAANARFGRVYQLTIPRRPKQYRRMVSVSLDEELDGLLEQTRFGSSRAEVVREILAAELPKRAGLDIS